MACPFFEPLAPVVHPESRNGRLPLIQEYEGVCHASGTGTIASGSVCNHGYANANVSGIPIANLQSRFGIPCFITTAASCS